MRLPAQKQFGKRPSCPPPTAKLQNRSKTALVASTRPADRHRCDPLLAGKTPILEGIESIGHSYPRIDTKGL